MPHRIEICCFCEKVRDEQDGVEVWRGFRTYMATHQFRPADIRLWHTYCAPCLASYRTFLASGPSVSAGHNLEAP